MLCLGKGKGALCTVGMRSSVVLCVIDDGSWLLGACGLYMQRGNHTQRSGCLIIMLERTCTQGRYAS